MDEVTFLSEKPAIDFDKHVKKEDHSKATESIQIATTIRSNNKTSNDKLYFDELLRQNSQLLSWPLEEQKGPIKNSTIRNKFNRFDLKGYLRVKLCICFSFEILT